MFLKKNAQTDVPAWSERYQWVLIYNDTVVFLLVRIILSWTFMCYFYSKRADVERKKNVIKKNLRKKEEICWDQQVNPCLDRGRSFCCRAHDKWSMATASDWELHPFCCKGILRVPIRFASFCRLPSLEPNLSSAVRDFATSKADTWSRNWNKSVFLLSIRKISGKKIYWRDVIRKFLLVCKSPLVTDCVLRGSWR